MWGAVMGNSSFEQSRKVDSATQGAVNDLNTQKLLQELDQTTRAITGPLADLLIRNRLPAESANLPSLDFDEHPMQKKTARAVNSARSSEKSDGPKGPTNEHCVAIKGPAGITDCFPAQLFESG